jgi:hypothetical protein
MDGFPHFGEVAGSEVPLHPVEADPAPQVRLSVPTGKFFSADNLFQGKRLSSSTLYVAGIGFRSSPLI